MSKDTTSATIFETHVEAEAAVRALQHSGFDLKKMSIMGKGFHAEEHVTGYYNAGDRMSYWGKNGAFWGGMWGMLFGTGVFFIPGIGQLVMAGPLIATIVSGLEGAAVVGGLSVLGAGLYSIGIPKDQVLSYETAIKSDKFVLVLHGSPAELARARAVLANVGSEALVHSA